jgi:PIN domain nuclease of toxin-antitoxin system
VRLLLDTQLAVWWQIASHKLPEAVRVAVTEADDAVFISRASLWELAIKTGMGKLSLDLRQFCKRVVDDGFTWLDITESHLLELAALPQDKEHRDAFDRLLVAQSLAEPLILLSVDSTLGRYGSTVRVLG